MADTYKINLYNFIQNFPNEQTCYKFPRSKEVIERDACLFILRVDIVREVKVEDILLSV
jgi:hypothetical protein